MQLLLSFLPFHIAESVYSCLTQAHLRRRGPFAVNYIIAYAIVYYDIYYTPSQATVLCIYHPRFLAPIARPMLYSFQPRV